MRAGGLYGRAVGPRTAVKTSISSVVCRLPFSVCSYLPQFLISFIGGVWADRYNRKRLIILSDGLIAAVESMAWL